MTNSKLVNELINREVLRTPRIIKAFLTVDRSFFTPRKFLAETYMNYPLPIGDRQTIPQPSSVAIMMELLEVREGDFVLELGAGSGWITALLARLVGPEGYVYSYEINRVVGEFGRKNISVLDFNNISFKVGDAKKYWDEDAPYNRIISRNPLDESEEEELLDLLAPEGIIITPTEDKDIKKITKDSLGNIHERKYSGFVFVPLPN